MSLLRSCFLNILLQELNVKCVCVCKDGARYIFYLFILRKSSKAPWTHCIIHKEDLTLKYLSPAVNQVLVNFIKSRSDIASLKKLCENLGAELLYQYRTTFCW